jgi:hypothetical protein
VKDIPVRIHQTRMRTRERESQFGLLCQAGTTSLSTKPFSSGSTTLMLI